MKLTIETTTGIVLAVIEVEPKATFKSIKSKIMDKCGVPPCLQILSFQGKGVEDDSVFSDFKMKRLTLVQKDSCDGGGCMKIMVKMEDDKLIPLGVHTFDTLRHIKGKLEKKTGIKVDDQQIFYKGDKLKNCKTLAEYDVVSMSTLLLIRRRTLKITVKMIDGLMFTVDSDSTDTVKNLKEKIADEEGFDIEEQRLIFQDDLLEDDRQVRQYNLQDGSVVWLIRSIESAPPAKRKCCSARNEVKLQGNSTVATMYEIYVRVLTGETRTFIVHGNMTIGDLKKMVMETEGTPIKDQRFIFAGKQLEDEVTFSAYQIQKEATIHQVLRMCGC